MIGKSYLEHGKPVVVPARRGKGGGPRNILIQREDGTKVVRPLSGVKKCKKASVPFLLMNPIAPAIGENIP
jgi:hypothetical protein